MDGTSPADLDAILRSVESSAAGLTSAEADARLRRLGPNILKADAEGHPLSLLVGQFRSPLVLVLLAAAAISIGVGEVGEALIIILIVAASSGLGFYQEYRASTAVRALRARLAIEATVLRDGLAKPVPMLAVVPGDVVLLRAGSLVAADAVLLESINIQADESALTGESFPVDKEAAAFSAAIGESNTVHLGTSIRSGTGKALVVSTGAKTRFGLIATLAGQREPETSFTKGIRRFGILMTQVMFAIVLLILPINILLSRPLLESLLFSSALAVGLTPELLPAIVTVTLSRGAQKLARAMVLVRRLVAIENLGAMDVLCTDKTGTLTEGAVRLALATDTAGEESAATLRWAYLNAALQAGLPNPIDAAITATPAPADSGQFVKLDEVPYDFERKRLSVLVKGPGGAILICKGAVGPVLQSCTSLLERGRAAALDAGRREEELRRLQRWSEEGYRVIAVATRPMGSRLGCDRADEAELTLVGYLLFSDPLKPGIAETIARLHDRGVHLKIITGDNRHAAAHVAREIGLERLEVTTGEEVATLSDRALARRVASDDVFAEITPDQKERIISALQRLRYVVGYLGDGINDAPALRASDIGISVDTAVDAARDAADVVLLRRDLDVLLEGVVLGRTAFANTLKYIAITTSANLGNMVSMAAMSLFLPFLPMLAKQILINNSLTDLPMLAISTDTVDGDVLMRPGRWDFSKLMQSMIGFGLVSSIFDALTFGVLLFVFQTAESTFQTAWFTVSLLTELAIIAVMRTARPFYRSPPSPLLVTTAVAVTAIALALPYTPLASAISLVPLAWPILLSCLMITAGYAITSEMLKGFMLQHPARRAVTDVTPRPATLGPARRLRRPRP